MHTVVALRLKSFDFLALEKSPESVSFLLFSPSFQLFTFMFGKKKIGNFNDFFFSSLDFQADHTEFCYWLGFANFQDQFPSKLCEIIYFQQKNKYFTNQTQNNSEVRISKNPKRPTRFLASSGLIRHKFRINPHNQICFCENLDLKKRLQQETHHSGNYLKKVQWIYS